jgi:DNA repair exonuclease SbcCD ATPase subunit
LEGEILNLRENLSSLGQVREEERSAAARLEGLERERKELTAELDIHRRIAQQELDKRYGAAKREWEKACANLEQVGEHPVFGTMTAREAWEYAQTKVEEQKAAEEENRRMEEQRAQLEEKQNRLRGQTTLWAVLTVLWLLALGASLWMGKWFSVCLLGCAAISSGANWLRLRNLRRQGAEEFEQLVPVDVPNAGDILEQAAAYRESLAKASQATLACAAAKKLMEELAARGGREFTTLEYLHPPVRSMAETTARLRWVEEEIARCRRSLDMLRGRMGTMGDERDISARLEELQTLHTRRQREYDALTVAMEALSNANDTLRQRFSPALNRAAGKLFSRMTGGEYSDLGLARTFEATATPEGELIPRSALALSRGTVEQLYLAVRLAVCQLTLAGEEPAPLVLDDALVNFDDGRMALALELLKELGEERQILLFSCHSREAAWAQAQGVPVCRLQSAQG